MDITNEQLEALSRFREHTGRQWKACLRESWLTGHYRWHVSKDDAPTLQRLRNTHGLGWLSKFKFPEGENA